MKKCKILPYILAMATVTFLCIVINECNTASKNLYDMDISISMAEVE